MRLKLYLDSSVERVKDSVNKSIHKINTHQMEFQIENMYGTLENQKVCNCVQRNTSGANRVSYEGVCVDLKQLCIDEKHIIITDKLFTDNWFAHGTAMFWFVSISDWDTLYSPPHMDKFIQYEIIQFFVVCAAQLSDAQISQAYHRHLETTDDCIFDFCERKSDIKISMRSGRICPGCERKIFDFGVTEEQFHAITILLKIMTGRAKFNNVFIVHGHGEYKDSVARYIENLKLTPIILSEQPNRGRTIIEKFERESSKADFAIILYTPDDIGGVMGSSQEDLIPRARQNVVFEHGFLTAKLGRENVVVLLKNSTKKLEIAGDNDGIIYVPFDDNGAWKEQIKKALKLSGYMINSECG